MSWEAWLTLAVVAGTIVVLALELTSPAAVVMGSVVLLMVTDVLEPAQALSGFANPAPFTVAGLYVIAAGVERTGLLSRSMDTLLGASRGERRILTRLVGPTAGASAFLNNTPIVAMLSPAVSRWARRRGYSASRLLMPVSFAAILGGMVTVIGTSTNIVVSGLLEDFGLEPLGFFEVAKLGLPVAVVGLMLLVAAAPAVLPRRKSADQDIEDSRGFTVEMRVDPGGPVAGMTVAEAGLRHLSGVFLVQVERGGRLMGAVGPDFALAADDTLRFVGNASEVADLHGTAGLVAAAKPAEGISPGKMAFFEAVVGVGSPLVGTSLREANFRRRYQAAVVAIHRADQRVLGKLGDVRLRVGDTLLVMAAQGFRRQWNRSSDFLIVFRPDAADLARSAKTIPAVAIGSAVVVAAATGLLSVLEASLLGALAMVLAGVLSAGEARGAVNLDVVVLIAASFGLGAAVASTGLASQLADRLVTVLEPLGGAAVLLGVALLALLLTEAVTNNAAAVLVFPLAIAVAADTGADPRAFAVVTALAASASFLTPIGYQTNTMVWGPGGYRFGDYARLGLPLTMATLAVVAAAAPLWWSI